MRFGSEISCRWLLQRKPSWSRLRFRATPRRSLLRSRKPIAPGAQSEMEAPLSWRFDEPDAMAMFDNVKVPWERVFVHNDPGLSRALYIETAAHSYGNHHSNVRLCVKLQMLAGLASRVAKANGADQVPAVRDAGGGSPREVLDLQPLWPVNPGRRGMADAGLRHVQPAHDDLGFDGGAQDYFAVIDTVRELLVRAARCRCRPTLPSCRMRRWLAISRSIGRRLTWAPWTA